MTRVQPDAQWVYVCGKGNDDGRPYVAQIDADGNLIVGASTVDAANVTYTPSTASDWNGGVDPGNQDSANDQLASRTKTLENKVSDTILPVRWHAFHDTSFVEVGNSIVSSAGTNQLYNVNASQTAAQNGDTFYQSCVLKAGAYTLRILGFTTSGSGKLDVYVKHVDAAGYTQIITLSDFYSSVTANNVVRTTTFTASQSGRYLFKFVVNGKNVSSSGYTIALTKFDVFLTAGDS